MRQHRHARPGGFTLIETLLVLAVIALLATLLLPGVNSLLRSIRDDDPERAVWAAITSAREQALTGHRSVWLRVEPKGSALVWGSDESWRRRTLPADVSVQLLRPQAGDTVLLGGVLVETQETPAVRFYPDGTCDRFRVQLREGRTAPKVMAVDPWTCAPVLTAAGR